LILHFPGCQIHLAPTAINTCFSLHLLDHHNNIGNHHQHQLQQRKECTQTQIHQLLHQERRRRSTILEVTLVMPLAYFVPMMDNSKLKTLLENSDQAYKVNVGVYDEGGSWRRCL
jgi:hypothetical protein